MGPADLLLSCNPICCKHLPIKFSGHWVVCGGATGRVKIVSKKQNNAKKPNSELKLLQFQCDSSSVGPTCVRGEKQTVT